MTDTILTLTDAERSACGIYHPGPMSAMQLAWSSGEVRRSTAIDLLTEVAAAMDKVPGDASQYDYVTLDMLRGRLLAIDYGAPEPPVTDEHIFLVAFDVTDCTDRDEAQRHLMARLAAFDSWWIAADDR